MCGECEDGRYGKGALCLTVARSPRGQGNNRQGVVARSFQEIGHKGRGGEYLWFRLRRAILFTEVDAAEEGSRN